VTPRTARTPWRRIGKRRPQRTHQGGHPPLAPDIVWDEITIEDPEMLEKPWSFTFAYYRKMKDYTPLEYICEDNREFAEEQGKQRINREAPK
jgi:hypothetical protein